MKKVVFLIGMMVGFTTTIFAQYDVVSVSSEEGFEEYDTWYQLGGPKGDYFFFGEYTDEAMTDYIKEYLDYMGGNFDKPTRVEYDGKIEHYIFENLNGDGTNSFVMVTYSEEENTILIIKSEE
jgi:hypothetical protein